MNFDQNNPVVKLCAKGMELDGSAKNMEAFALFKQAWDIASNDFEKFIAAHYVARHQESVADKLLWDEVALDHALKIDDESIKVVLPSLYLNIGKCHEDMCDISSALNSYNAAQNYATHLANDGYGDMIRAGIDAGRNRVLHTKNYKMEHYENEIIVNTSCEFVYQALTKFIPQWWSELFEGVSDTEGGIFTVRFGEHIYKTFMVEHLQPSKQIVWLVKDSMIDIPELMNKTEWIGTKTIWNLDDKGGSTQLKLTHAGLTPHIECYDICRAGWAQFINSLKAFAETGEGMPFKG